MEVLLFEWASAGGKASRGFLPEGFAMLRTLASSFGNSGFSTTALVSGRIGREAAYLGCDRMISVEKEPLEDLERISGNCDAAFAIAPESQGILGTVSGILARDTQLLSCPGKTIELLSDKARTNDAIGRLASNIVVPAYTAVEADPRLVLEECVRLGLPCVLKPRDGAGSAGITLIRSEDDCRRACARLGASGWREGLLQRYVQGRHLSATFIARGTEIQPLSVNTQAISLSGSFEYSGGSLPHPLPEPQMLWKDLEVLSRKHSLQGLMGVDFVLDPGGVLWFIEANPRATTSCLGVDRVVKPRLAALIAGESGEVHHEGYAQWATFPIGTTLQASDKLVSQVMEIPSVVSPPFAVGPFMAKGASKVLVCASATDAFQLGPMIAEARARLSELHLVC